MTKWYLCDIVTNRFQHFERKLRHQRTRLCGSRILTPTPDISGLGSYLLLIMAKGASGNQEIGDPCQLRCGGVNKMRDSYWDASALKGYDASFEYEGFLASHGNDINQLLLAEDTCGGYQTSWFLHQDKKFSFFRPMMDGGLDEGLRLALYNWVKSDPVEPLHDFATAMEKCRQHLANEVLPKVEEALSVLGTRSELEKKRLGGGESLDVRRLIQGFDALTAVLRFQATHTAAYAAAVAECLQALRWTNLSEIEVVHKLLEKGLMKT